MNTITKKAIDYLVKLEGGYDKIHKDPNDLGGVTRAGISSKWFPHLDLENMTHDEIRDFYYKEFYERLEIIPFFKIRHFLFFTAINAGTSVYKSFQQHINEMLYIYGIGKQIQVDGIIGNNTIKHMKIVIDCIKEKERYGNEERVYLYSFIDYVIREWKESKSAKYHLAGWMNRLHNQMEYVLNEE